MGHLYLKYVKRAFPLKHLALLFVMTALAVTAGVVLYGQLSKDILILDNGKPIAIKTMGTDVNQALDQMGIKVESTDYISEKLNNRLAANETNTVYIKRAVPVYVKVDGKSQNIKSYRSSVSEIIKDQGIVLGPLDKLNGVSLRDPVEEGMTIQVIRIKEEIVTEQEQIPFNVVEKPNKTMNEGTNKTVVEGENGIREKYFKITYEDGKPVNRNYVNEKVVKNPVDNVVEYGTVPNFVTSRGDTVRYKKVVENIRATAYTASFIDTGKRPGDPGFGICYTGLRAREGVIAVDPKVIPLGTKLYIEVPGSAPDYGFAIAGDIGSAIKGNKIDLYFDTMPQVLNWGVRKVKVYILNEQDDKRWQTNNEPCSK